MSSSIIPNKDALQRFYRDMGITYLANTEDQGRLPSQKRSEYPEENHEKKQQLQQLLMEIESFDGCLLVKTATHTVFSRGNPDASIMWIGEAPGEEEDRYGKPFIGKSGKLLDLIFEAIPLSGDQIYISNMIPWRPPFNRTPTSEEIAACLPFIQRHIAIVQPKAIVALGSIACKGLLETAETITRLQQHQQWYSSPFTKDPLPIFAFYHPSYLLRSPLQKRAAWKQLRKMISFFKEQNLLVR